MFHQEGGNVCTELKGFGVAKKEDRGEELWESSWVAVSVKMYVCACARAEYQILTFSD